MVVLLSTFDRTKTRLTGSRDILKGTGNCEESRIYTYVIFHCLQTSMFTDHYIRGFHFNCCKMSKLSLQMQSKSRDAVCQTEIAEYYTDIQTLCTYSTVGACY